MKICASQQGEGSKLLTWYGPGCYLDGGRHLVSNPVCKEESKGKRKEAVACRWMESQSQGLESEEKKPRNTEGAEGVDTRMGVGSTSLCVQQLPEPPRPLQAPAKAAATGCVSLTPGAC